MPGSDGRGSLEPRARTQTLEDLARLGEKSFRPAAAFEPLGVLETDDSERKRHLELTEQLLGEAEVSLYVAQSEPCPEPRLVIGASSP